MYMVADTASDTGLFVVAGAAETNGAEAVLQLLCRIQLKAVQAFIVIVRLLTIAGASSTDSSDMFWGVLVLADSAGPAGGALLPQNTSTAKVCHCCN